MEDDSSVTVALRAGDIISITAPGDQALDGTTFLVSAITDTSVELVGRGGAEETLEIDDGDITNPNITAITIVSRGDLTGYSDSLGLAEGGLVRIHLEGGERVDGAIVKKEEDAVVIRPLDGGEPFTLDFAYRGIPEGLGIERIEPIAENLMPSVQTVQEETTKQLESQILEADTIQIGPELDEITQVVDVPDAQKRFGLAAQLDDLQDELLSVVPNNERTASTLASIHSIVQRYKELRAAYSAEDERGVGGALPAKGPDFQPAQTGISTLTDVPTWVKPVISQSKYAYDAEIEAGEESGLGLIPTTLPERQERVERVLASYEAGTLGPGTSSFASFLRAMAKVEVTAVPGSSGLTQERAQSQFEVVVSTDGELVASAVGPGGKPTAVRNFGRVVLPPTYIYQAERSRDGDLRTRAVPAALGEDLQLVGILTSPYKDAKAAYNQRLGPGIMIRAAQSLGAPRDKDGDILERASGDPDLADCILSRRVYVAPPAASEGGAAWDTLVTEVLPTSLELVQALAEIRPLPLSVSECLEWIAPYGYARDNIESGTLTLIEALVAKGMSAALADAKREVGEIPTSAPQDSPSPLDLLASQQLRKLVQTGYRIDKDACSASMCASSIWYHMCAVDSGRLFSAALAYSNVELLMADGSMKIKELDEWIASPTKSRGRCSTFVLAKRAEETSEGVNPLMTGPSADIYDPELDPTPYGIAASIPPTSDPIDYLMEALKIDRETAARHQEAITSKTRRVVDGDRAELIRRDGSTSLFIWKKGKWVEDKTTTASPVGSSQNGLCDAQPACVSVQTGKQCVSTSEAPTVIAKANLRSALDNIAELFDTEVLAAKSEMKARGQELLARASARVHALLRSRLSALTQKTLIRPTAGGRVEPEEAVRNHVLSLGDMASRQTAIKRFVEGLTRAAIEDRGEDPNWLYSVNTGKMLLPSFYDTLATVFLDKGDYIGAVEEICRTRGTLSDDGESWVDKHSGYEIVAISFDTSEGYTEDGFKQQSRALLAKDLNIDGQAQTDSFASPEAKAISVIARGLALAMGVDVTAQLDMIVGGAVKAHTRLIPSEARFRKALEAARAKGRKKGDDYESLVAQSLVISAAVYLLVALQTTLPPTVIRRRIPGCSPTLNGYPLGPAGDDRSVEYMACVLASMKGGGGPWRGVKRTSRASLVRKMLVVLEKHVMRDQGVQAAYAGRRYYDSTHQEAQAVEIQSISWPGFLPPLRPVEVDGVAKPTPAFTASLMRDVQTGKPAQFRALGTLNGKIAYFALQYTQGLRSIVSEEEAHLRTADEVPFLENSCCSDGPTLPLAYFGAKRPSLLAANDATGEIYNAISTVARMARAPMLFDPADTKRKYPDPPAGFAKATIYRAFIHYCRWGTDLASPGELLPVCGPPPASLSLSSTIDEQIASLEGQGKSYDAALLLDLLDIVNLRNKVELDLYSGASSPLQNLRSQLQRLADADSTVVPQVLVQKLESALDSFELDTEGGRSLRNYLATSNDKMLKGLLASFARSPAFNLSKAVRRCLETLKGQGCEAYVRSMTRVLPAMIVSGQSYENVRPPAHWGLSRIHARDYASILQRHFEPLRKLYGHKGVKAILEEWMIRTEPLWPLVAQIPVLPGDGPLSERTYDLLSRYCVLLCLSSLIEAFAGVRYEATAGDRGASIVRGEEGADVAHSFLKIICTSAEVVGMDLQQIKDRVNRSKEKEKDGITAYLKNMTDEEREIENLFKNNKLGKWSAGLQKGVSQYDQGTYDRERGAIDDLALAELREGSSDIVSELTGDIYAMDRLEAIAEEERAEAEAYDMSALPDDDDYGDEDGDM